MIRTSIVCGPPMLRDVPLTTVSDFIRERARGRPGDTALIDAATDARCTYGALDHLIGRFAAGLAANGFAPGDTFFIVAPNSPEWPIAALGALSAGGVLSAANPAYGADKLANQMRETGARFVFTALPFLTIVREAAAQVGRVTLIVLGEGVGDLSFASLLASREPEPVLTIDVDARAAIPYSSGTAGVTKGAILTHRAMLWNLCQITQAIPMKRADVALVVLPMFHIFGFNATTLCRLATGAIVVTLPRFEPETFLRAIERYHVTHLGLVPPLMQFLATHPLVETRDLSTLKGIVCGAAPLASALQRRVGDRLKCRVSQGFGMTESSGAISVSHPDRIRLGASGQLLPATEARIVDPETLIDNAPGSPGELWFRGPQAFTGYLNEPDATAATRTADGWVRTGDIGYIDADGYVFITDRLKELIKVKGFGVAPAELEMLLLTHPSIVDAGVIGRPDDRLGEIPVAYVVTSGPIDRDEIKAWVAQHAVGYRQLGDILMVESIPRSPAGKVLRRVLRVRDAQRVKP